MVFLWRNRLARWDISLLQDRRLRSILGVLVMGFLGYIRNRGKRRSAWTMKNDHDHNQDRNGTGWDREQDRGEDAGRVDELLREQMRRYEQDLHELADA
jgi:hypothetical protein